MAPFFHRPIAPTKSTPQPKTSVEDHTHENTTTKNQIVSKSPKKSQDDPMSSHPPESHTADNSTVDVSDTSVPPRAKSLFNTSRQTSQSLHDNDDVRKSMTFSLSRNRDLIVRTKRGRGRGILKDRPHGVRVGGGGEGHRSHDGYVQSKTTGELQSEDSNTDVTTSDNVSRNEPPVTNSNMVEQTAIPSTGQFDNIIPHPNTHQVTNKPVSNDNDTDTPNPGDAQLSSKDTSVSNSKADEKSVDFEGISLLPQFPAGVVAKTKRYSSRRQKTGGGEQVFVEEPSGTKTKYIILGHTCRL